MKKSILFISCDEAAHICDKKQYGEASKWEIFKLRLRLSWCHISRAYSQKNEKLSELIQNAEVDCLKDTEKHKIQEEFQRELAKYQ